MTIQMKYAAIINSSYTVPSDERSRTNPGHGYPEHSVETIILQEFKNEEEMKQWVLSRGQYDMRYRIIRYVELTVETQVSVRIK